MRQLPTRGLRDDRIPFRSPRPGVVDAGTRSGRETCAPRLRAPADRAERRR